MSTRVPADHEHNLQRGAAERVSKEVLIRPGDSSCLARRDKVCLLIIEAPHHESWLQCPLVHAMPKDGPLTQPSFYNGQTGPCTDVHLCAVAWHTTVLCVGRPCKGDICLIDPHLCAAPLMPARWPCVTASTSGQGPRSAPLHASANRPGTGSTYCARKSPKLRRPAAGKGVLQMWCHILRKEVANAAAHSASPGSSKSCAALRQVQG